MAYTKLWHRIVTSSIWDAEDHTRLVWITMLALANRDGYVESTRKALSLLARVPFHDCVRALEGLSSPDPDSRTPDDDGRRIEAVQGGWILLNYARYRDSTSDDPHAVKARDRQRLHRERARARDSNVTFVTSRDPAYASASDSSSGIGEGIGEGAAPGGPDPAWTARRDAVLDALCPVLGRERGRMLSSAETVALMDVTRHADGLDADLSLVVGWLRDAGADDRPPESLEAVLSGWHRCVDRARAFRRRQERGTARRRRPCTRL
jgi:hypothetical protein